MEVGVGVKVWLGVEEDGDTRAPFRLESLGNKGIEESNSLLIYRFLKVVSAFAKVTANETLY